MTIGILVFLGLTALAVGFVWCIKHDLPHLYLKVRRVVTALMTGMFIHMATSYVLLSLFGCNDVDKYSALWYAMGCWYWETSH